ncbi:MAG: hypothetical protein QOD74_1093 [Variibacter sp.]|nr:hypothetical protein [Variibacter sp.]
MIARLSVSGAREEIMPIKITSCVTVITGALLLSGFVPFQGAQAADIYAEPPPPYAGGYVAPPPAAVYVPAPPPPAVYARPAYPPPDGPCRIREKRYVDPYGREVIRRFRICDEGIVERYVERPRYFEERIAPRPPTDIRPNYGYAERSPYIDREAYPPARPEWRRDEPDFD